MSSKELPLSIVVIAIIAVIIAFSNLAIGLDMVPLPLKFIPWLIFLLAGYMFAVQIIKKLYIKKYGEWI